MWAGIPYCPVSPAYSLVAGDLAKFRYVMDLLTPGLVAAFDTGRFARAFARVGGDVEIVGDAPLAARGHVARCLEREVTTPVLAARNAATDGFHRAIPAHLRFHRPSEGGDHHQPHVLQQRGDARQSMPFLATEPPVLLDWLPWNHTFGGSHNLGPGAGQWRLALYRRRQAHSRRHRRDTAQPARDLAHGVFQRAEGLRDAGVQPARRRPLRRNFYRRLRAYFFAGASLAQHTWDELDAASMRELGFRTPMLSGLGATETGPSVTFTTPQMGRSGVIGLPAAGTLVKLAPVEDKLEIRVRGPAVTPGYWRQPDLTAQAFDDEGFYRLGDAVRLIDPADPTAGLRFDGRIGEDFKLANGTWVSVGPLRADHHRRCRRWSRTW